jgi:biotin operon repressor
MHKLMYLRVAARAGEIAAVGYLESKGLYTARKVLVAITGTEYRVPEDVAADLKVSPSTVRQIIQALRKGGLTIEEEFQEAIRLKAFRYRSR